MLKNKISKILLCIALFTGTVNLHGEELIIDFPLACNIGKDCFFTNLVQHTDSSGKPVDFTCDSNTYDGHKGTDIAVKDYTANIVVLAPIAGTITGVRNSMPDEILTKQTDLKKVKGRECGNGLVIKQGSYTAQLCHLKQGSVKVKVGDEVKASDEVGVVGLSGKTYFPHLHFSIKDISQEPNILIDPFYGEVGKCGGEPISSWREPNLAGEIQDGQIFGLGPAIIKPNKVDAILGKYKNITVTKDAKILTAWVGAYFVKRGDLLKLKLYSPSGRIFASNKKYFNKDYAQYFLYAGKRNRSKLKAGKYKIVAEYKRGNSRITNTETKEFIVE